MNEEESWTVFRLPRSHWHCQLSNFSWEGVRPSKTREVVEDFVGKVIEGGSPHLVMYGDPGIGKSHLGVGIYRRLVPHFGTLQTAWLNVPAFCDQVKATYSSSDASPFEEYQEATRLVVLDDLFGRDLTPHEIGQHLYRLIDIAYSNRAAVVLNMNCELREMGSYLRPHEVSRVLESSTVLPMSAELDWRRKQ